MGNIKLFLLILSPFIVGVAAYVYMDSKFQVVDYFSELIGTNNISVGESEPTTEQTVGESEPTTEQTIERVVDSEVNKENNYESDEKRTISSETNKPENNSIDTSDTSQNLRIDMKKPSFDVLQVSPDGQIVVAGSTSANTEVELIVGDNAIASVNSDDDGKFVFIVESELSSGAYDIKVKATNDDGEIKYSKNATALIPKNKKEKTATVIYDSNEEVSEVIRNRENDKKLKDLVLDTITFDQNNNILVTGLGMKGSKIYVYIDNKNITKTIVDNSGKWKSKLFVKLDEGEHILRLDQMADDRVISRLETPFIKLAKLPNVKKGSTVVINSGDTLWAIARHVYGKGIKYISIYKANEEHIKDPDLIYPGQIFLIPANR